MQRLLGTLFLILMISGCAGIKIEGTEYEKRAIEIQQLVSEIQSALSVVDEEVEKKTNLKLNNAFLIVNTEIAKKKEGGADLWVVSGKASKEDKSSDVISIKLVPFKPTKIMGQPLQKTLSERLAMSIISAVEGVSKVGSGKYPMIVSNLTIEMSIITKTEGSAGADIKFEVLPVSASGKGTYSKYNNDVLKLEFIQKK